MKNFTRHMGQWLIIRLFGAAAITLIVVVMYTCFRLSYVAV